MRRLTLLAVLVMLGGCFNGGNTAVRLGDVSLGQQLIDLKRALDEGAMTDEEYTQARQSLLSLAALCQNTEED
ncbi:MAG: SHOCT domain-containing protein [Pseudomonadales bacterium]